MDKTKFYETMTFNKNFVMNQYDSTLSNGDNKRASTIVFKGKDSAGSVGTLASIMTCHSGIIKDHKGKIKFNVNDGSSQEKLHNIMTIGPSEIKNSGSCRNSTDLGTIQLASDASDVDDFYNNYIVKITSGDGKGQRRKIIGYVGGVYKVATIEKDWGVDKTPSANDKYEVISASVTIHGDLNVSSIISSTNTTISDNMIELNSGLTGANSNDCGILIERGSTGDNAFMGWNETSDRFILATTTATNTVFGDFLTTITPTYKPLEISNLFLKTDGSSINFGADDDIT